jgi:hypothetical protein
MMTAPADGRIQVRIDGDLAEWLNGRADLMHNGPSLNIQARIELGMWRDALPAELRRIRLTLAQASCIADVCNGWLMSPGIAVSLGLVYAECYDAFRIARDTPLGDLSSYGAKWGPEGCDPVKWEQDLLTYLGTLGPVADHALQDAIARWWESNGDTTVEGFAKIGLRVTE